MWFGTWTLSGPQRCWAKERDLNRHCKCEAPTWDSEASPTLHGFGDSPCVADTTVFQQKATVGCHKEEGSSVCRSLGLETDLCKHVACIYLFSFYLKRGREERGRGTERDSFIYLFIPPGLGQVKARSEKAPLPISDMEGRELSHPLLALRVCIN